MAQRLNVANLRIKSPAFEGHKRIPDKHTSNGENVAPPLEWSGAPDGTQAFAIVVHDPDAPLVDGFTHWVAYGIPASTTSLPEGVDLPPGLDRRALLEQIEDHVIEQARVIGTYSND